MRNVQPCSHTVQSHGVKLARTYICNWIVIVILMLLVNVLSIGHPFYQFVGKDMMSDLKYPHKSETVPFWAVLILAVLLPAAVILLFYFQRRDVYDLHHATLGILFSVLITGVITNTIKDAVGWPRPDFYWRCFPDGKELYDQVTGNVICHGKQSVINKGHKSFPSGHTSWCFAGLSFFTLYLSGKIKVFDCRGHVGKLCIAFLPLLAASLVGISRVDDYRHHWQDVFIGGLLGMMVATVCYLQFFPAPYHADGWAPYAYFQTLEAERGNANPLSNAHQHEGRNCSGSCGAHDNRSIPQELELSNV